MCKINKPDLPGHYWLKAYSPGWLWNLWSCTWFHSWADWHPPPETRTSNKAVGAPCCKGILMRAQLTEVCYDTAVGIRLARIKAFNAAGAPHWDWTQPLYKVIVRLQWTNTLLFLYVIRFSLFNQTMFSYFESVNLMHRFAPYLCSLLSELLLLEAPLLSFLLQFLHFLHAVGFPTCCKERKQVFWTTILKVLLMLFCNFTIWPYLKTQSTQTRQIAALRSFSYAYNKTVDCFYFAPWLKWSIPIRAGTTMCDSLQENQSNVTESWENMFTFSF